MKRLFLVLMVLLGYSSVALARTWYVRPDGTGDVPTIAVAVDSAAAEGDTVLLADGTFTGEGNKEVDCLDKALTIVSESGNAELCIIDCGTPPVCNELLVALYFRESAHGVPRLEGVTIKDGCGGVICDSGSAPVISNCIFRDNVCGGCEVGFQGAGMRCYSNSTPIIINCLFVDNHADGGGGLCTKGGYPTLYSVTFLNNSASGGGGMLIEDGGFAHLTGCTFSGNHAECWFGSRFGGGGLCCRSSAELVDCAFRNNSCYQDAGGGLYFLPDSDSDEIRLIGCTFASNTVENSPGGGGGMAAGDYLPGSVGSISITNCTFYGNADNSVHGAGGVWVGGDFDVVIENSLIAFGGQGPAVFCWDPSKVTLQCCDLFGNAGGDWEGCIADQYEINGNFSADPKFCDTLSGDFQVEDCSPCLPGYHPDGYDCGGSIGAYGSGCACGAGTEPTTWGAIKSMYR
jgi:hypothetical protein